MKVYLTYFKSTGKFYSEGSYESNKEHLFEVFQEVRAMADVGMLPGLAPGHGNYFVSVSVPDDPNDHPHLVIHGTIFVTERVHPYPTIAVNMKSSPYDVYIGRAGHGKDGYFGNPFLIGPSLTREQSLWHYNEYFIKRVKEDTEFRSRILELKGKRLGCFCKPLDCHGDIIAKYLDFE